MQRNWYDGDGKRIKKVEASQTTIYIYLGWNIIYEKESSTNTETKYIYKADCSCLVGKVVGQVKYYLHADHLGSIRQMTDENGNAVWTSPAVYDPFGELRGGGPANNGEHTYTGKLEDLTGLYYFGARYYDPKIGRFITKDLWGGDMKMPQTLNDYIFVLNNPLRLVDLIGNSPSCPLCHPNEGKIVPPLPAAWYILGLFVAFGLTCFAVEVAGIGVLDLIVLGGGELLDLFGEGLIRGGTYLALNSSKILGYLSKILSRSILFLENTPNYAKAALEFLEFIRENPDFAKGLMLEAIAEVLHEYPQEIAHIIDETAIYIWHKLPNGTYEPSEVWTQEWEHLPNGTWVWKGKWNCSGSRCQKGPP